MFFYELSKDELNLLKHFLTTFLTTKLKPKRNTVIDLSLEMIFYLFQAQGNEGFASEIARYYGHNDKNGHKCYEYIIKKLVKCDLIKVINTPSNFKRILLNKNVRKLLKKMLGRVAELRSSGVEGAEIEFNLSESSRTARAHRILSIYAHNLSFRSFQRLRGDWSHNHSRCITHEYSDNISDNFCYKVQWFKDKLMIFSPTAFDSWENFSKLKNMVEVESGRLSKVLERRYDTELAYLDSVLMGDEHQVKMEIESQDPLSVHVASMFKEAGYSQYQTPHYKYNADYRGMEYIQAYKHRGVEGYGPTLFTQLLVLPEDFLEHRQEYRNNTSLLLQRVQELDLKEERRLDREEKRDLILENMLTYITDNLASKDDVESIRAALHQKVLKYEAGGEFEQKRIITLRAGEERQVETIIELLQEGEKTQKELAKQMGYTSTAAISVAIQYLDKNKLVHVETIPTGKRGRPKKKYRIVNQDV